MNGREHREILTILARMERTLSDIQSQINELGTELEDAIQAIKVSLGNLETELAAAEEAHPEVDLSPVRNALTDIQNVASQLPNPSPAPAPAPEPPAPTDTTTTPTETTTTSTS